MTEREKVAKTIWYCADGDRKDNRMWRRFSDGWFTYYYNIDTGERKFELEPGDVLID